MARISRGCVAAWVLIIGLALIGCQPSNQTSIVKQPDDAAAGTGEGGAEGSVERDGSAGAGGICRFGARGAPTLQGEPAPVALPCAEGLDCCYPCGMQGCDWVCATAQECESWRTLP